MAEGNWDDDIEEPTKVVIPKVIATVTDKWDGEDEDEPVRENWEDDDEEKPEDNAAATTAIEVKKKKNTKLYIAEKEEKKRLELEEKKKKDDEAKRQMTPKERHEEKLREKKRDEEADLALVIDAFGLGEKDDKSSVSQIDSLTPVSKADFDKLSELLVAKFKKFESSPHYASFLDPLYRNLALSLEAEDIKRLSSTLSVLASEKAKLKPKTGKKGAGKKPNIFVGKEGKVDDCEANYVDEFDDYL